MNKEKKWKDKSLEERYGDQEYVSNNMLERAKRNQDFGITPAPNEQLGRQTSNWNSDGDQFNPYAPLMDLLYQRQKVVERANEKDSFSESPYSNKSQLEYLQQKKMGNLDYPFIVDSNGQNHPLDRIDQLNELDSIIQKRLEGSNEPRFTSIKKLIDSSRKKLQLGPDADNLKDRRLYKK